VRGSRKKKKQFVEGRGGVEGSSSKPSKEVTGPNRKKANQEKGKIKAPPMWGGG